MANSSTSAWTAAASTLLLLLAITARAEVVLTEGTNISVDVTSDGRCVTDLLGRLWLIPVDGGEAVAITDGMRPASRPRWSPGADRIVYESRDATGTSLWLRHLDTAVDRPLSEGRYSDREPSWHPDGSRIVFSSSRHDTGFDIWEMDVPTGLSWRLTRTAGSESEPAWSANGRDLVWIHRLEGRWSLMLRRRGQPAEVLVTSDTPLASPAWRPDGSLVTYLKLDEDGWAARMTILSDPRLDRELINDEDLFLFPIAWRDRQAMFYTANGRIRTRGFDQWTSADVRFDARVEEAGDLPACTLRQRTPPDIERPPGRIVLRPARLYDGLFEDYVPAPDIVIEDGRIVSVEPRRDQPGQIVIDVSDLTALPGIVDAWADIPDDASPALGPLLLAMGVTTMVADDERAADLDAIWAGKEVPGPRVLRAAAVTHPRSAEDEPWLVYVSADQGNAEELAASARGWRERGVKVLALGWQIGVSTGADLILGTDNRPPSPGGIRYSDLLVSRSRGAVNYLSGLADAGTSEVESIWSTRPARLLSRGPRLTNRIDRRDLSAIASDVVLGSRPNGMPPGIATHAELRALVDAGLSARQALRAGGVNATDALRIGSSIGRVAPGAEADLVLVDGDPLSDIADALNVVAIVRNGRFYSLSGLLDRHLQAKSVE